MISYPTIEWVPQKTKFRQAFWAAAPKGTKSCRTQGDFCWSVCPFVCWSVCLFILPPALSGLKSALSGLKSALSGLESALLDLKSALFGLCNLPFQIQGPGGQISGMRGTGGDGLTNETEKQTDGWMNRGGGQTNKRMDGQSDG